MAVLAAPATTRRTRWSARRALAWHPEWWVYAVAGLAWLALGLMPLASVGAGPHEHHAMAMAAETGFVSSWSAAWSHWALMVAAMMLPVVAPLVRTVALRSLWTRRQRSAGAFLAGYVVLWVAVGAVLLAPLVALDAYPLGPAWLVGMLLVAAGWQVSAPRRRLLRRCGSLRMGAADGTAADVDCARAGVRSGARCLATCGPPMLAMLAGHSLWLMAGLLGVLLSERSRGPDPVGRAGRPREAWMLAGLAGVVALAAALS
jgi:predicted metal-binding membrane protein